MPRLVNRNPRYCKHRASGQAVVTLNGQDIYLGPHGTAASKREYDRVVAEWLANGRDGVTGKATDLCVVELVAAYWRHAQTYYAKPQDADSNGTLSCFRHALAVVKRLYEDTRVCDFGPLALKAVREDMVRRGWARTHVNQQVGRVRQMFRWGVENEMVPPSVLHGLQAVGGLRRGKTAAKETAPVRPVADATVDAVRPYLARQVWAMIELQRLTGMRPGEVVRMRTGDIDRSGTMPAYRPRRHKTQHHGHTRAVYLGERCEEVVTPFLKPDPEAFMFSPADAEAQRREKLSLARQTAVSCGNRPGTNKRRRPKHQPGSRYTVTAYLRAIYAGCDKAFPAPPELARQRVPARGRKGKRTTRWETAAEWKARLGPEAWARLTQWQQDHRFHPNQLRHSAATRLRRTRTLDEIQAVLGHRNVSTTQIYAELDAAKAMDVMAEAG